MHVGTHPQSSSSLSTFLPAFYPTSCTGTRENAFLALRGRVFVRRFLFFFFSFFYNGSTMRRMRMYFGEEEEGQGGQGGELRRSMTSFHPIREITSEKNGIMYSASLKNFRFSTISYFKLNYFTYLFFASSFYIRVEVIRNFLPCISSHLRFLEEKLEEILKRSKYLNFHALSLSLSLWEQKRSRKSPI